MDNQRSPLLSWAYYCQGKSNESMEELRQLLLLTTLELENTRIRGQEELKMRDDELIHLKDLLNKAIRERDEAQEKCQRLVFEKLFLQQQQQLQQQYQQTAPISGISSIEDEPRRGLDSNNGFSSSDCEESIVSSPVIDPIQPPVQVQTQAATVPIVGEKALPEKGKLLQAVMKAGPLLQTLLLAGPLPQWRHPPPPLDSYQIPPPPVAIPSLPSPTQLLHQDCLLNISAAACNNNNNNSDNCGTLNRKRGLCEVSESPTENKYQRLVLQ